MKNDPLFCPLPLNLMKYDRSVLPMPLKLTKYYVFIHRSCGLSYWLNSTPPEQCYHFEKAMARQLKLCALIPHSSADIYETQGAMAKLYSTRAVLSFGESYGALGSHIALLAVQRQCY